tara:strand:+ start:39 stop:404 length:366 start_codon:yes stop_codon:yes gene_type:complete
MNPLNKICIECNNIENAVAFYKKALGIKEVERFPIKYEQDYVYLQSGELIIELMPNKSEKQAQIHHLSFSSSNISKDANRLTKNKVVTTKKPFDVGVANIKLAFFLDPDGNNIQLYERQKP